MTLPAQRCCPPLPAAFDALFRLYHGPLTFYAYGYTRYKDAAEEIVLACFAALRERRKIPNSIQWLYCRVYEGCCQFLKQRGMAMPEAGDAIEQRIIAAETLVSFVRWIEGLEGITGVVMRMYYLQGKSLGEIGREAGIEPETVILLRYRGLHAPRHTNFPG